jgi:hypothetical protein
MRVRILSGNTAGGEQDVPDVEGEVMLATGYAERVTDVSPPAPVVEPPSAPADVEADAQATADNTGGE